MKKLALAFVTSALFATPALACPGMESHDMAPKTAKKTNQEPAKKDDAKAKDAAKPAQKDQKPDTAKTKDGEKKPDKVSQN